jgi:hypothetical protein
MILTVMKLSKYDNNGSQGGNYKDAWLFFSRLERYIDTPGGMRNVGGFYSDTSRRERNGDWHETELPQYISPYGTAIGDASPRQDGTFAFVYDYPVQ